MRCNSQPARPGPDRPGDPPRRVDDLGGAVEDLDLAERMGAPPDSLAAARLSLADRVAEECCADLDSGDPPALERIEDLARQKVKARGIRGPARSPRAWQARWGRGPAASSAGRRSSSTGPNGSPAAPAHRAQQAAAAAKAELEARQKAAAPKVEALYTALAEGKWPTILTAAEAVLAAIPEHPAARQARSRAWQQIAAIAPAAAGAVAAARAGRGATTAARRARRGPRSRPRPRSTRGRRRSPSRRGRRHLLAGRRGSPRPAAGVAPAEQTGSSGRPRPRRRSAPSDRWPAPRPTAPRAASSCGSTASAATWSAWTTASSWAGPAPIATPTSR